MITRRVATGTRLIAKIFFRDPENATRGLDPGQPRVFFLSPDGTKYELAMTPTTRFAEYSGSFVVWAPGIWTMRLEPPPPYEAPAERQFRVDPSAMPLN